MLEYNETEISRRMRIRVGTPESNELKFDDDLRNNLLDEKGKFNQSEAYNYILASKLIAKSYTSVNKKDLARVIIKNNLNDDESAELLEEFMKRKYGDLKKNSKFYNEIKEELAEKCVRILHYFFDISLFRF